MTGNSSSLATHAAIRRQGVLVAAIALGVRSLYVMAIVWRYGTAQASDFLYMHQLADALAHGRGFTIDGVRIFNQSVGYPAFLAPFYAIFGARVGVALVLNVLLGALSAWLVHGLAWRLMSTGEAIHRSRIHPQRVALMAGCLAAVYPDSLLYAGLVSAENLLVPLMLLLAMAVVQAWKREWFAGLAVGVVAALTASVKAHVLFWCLAIPLVWRTQGHRAYVRTACAAIGAVVILTPWTVANHRASGGHLIPFSAVAGEVFLDGTNPQARGTPSNAYHLSSEEEAGRSPLELDRMRMRRALSHIRERPQWYVQLCMRKLLLSFSPVRDYMFEFQGQSRLGGRLLSRWLPTAFNSLLLASAAVGLWFVRHRLPTLAFGLSLVAAAELLQIIFCAYSRYRYPFLFCLLPYCAAGILGCMGRLAQPRES